MNFAGTEHRARERLTFGRDADIILDTNRYLHRRTGAFIRADDGFWLHNLGTRLHLAVADEVGNRADLAPGGRQLAVGSGTVRIVAGPATYELDYRVDGTSAVSQAGADESDAGTQTIGLDLELTPREVDFLVTFAQPYLLGHSRTLPTYADVASTWFVSPKTLDNSLQAIKRKFRAAGLVRDPNLEALVLTAIQHSLVTRADLDWVRLEGGQPRSTAERSASR